MQTESHNTQSVYRSAELNRQYSWHLTEWQTYWNDNLNVTNCNANSKPQHSLYTALYCQLSGTDSAAGSGA